ncbi:hypothetical protein [Niabella drilacis]|uniref:ZU5 domain-containing protein n=1 Tax=Niabella drilacis (strain DSM 25811 / CCM 8410 / CCUG 62505 / LMG 26954 / E90) TaxID=1285928 RepID=A0A1G6ILG2_NIADE|nr:hypothetical protein [Niabella drilacis]SDC07260.1 hypothetical protein SAMN04487894_101262 [Niabella drilacis]
MKKINVWLCVILLASACTKPDLSSPVSIPGPLITVPGIPQGSAITKTIGVSGGSLTSADGDFSVIIPAGALAGNQEISVQPVMNQLPAGYGRAYRLTPHTISFQKPVTIRFRYEENSIRNTAPELLGIAYQDQEGKWFHAAAPMLDKENRTLTVSSTHFSDWGFFPYFYIDPARVLTDPGAQLDLRVMATVPDNSGYIPLPGESPVLQPYQPDNSYFGAWNYSGNGSLEGKGNTAHYRAPDAAPKVNPESVSVAVKMQRKGQFLLVSNITIRTAFHIDYMQVDETELYTGGFNYPSRLWIYGSFGEDPGKGKRSVKINNTDVTVATWMPGMIACDIPTSGPYASGIVKVEAGAAAASKLLNEWVLDMYYDKVESPGGALTKKVNLVLRFRGDAEGFFQQGQVAMVKETNLHESSKGIINMPAGSYTNHVTMDACGDYTVKWDAIRDLVVSRKKYTEADGLSGSVVNKPNGFDLKIRLMAENVLMTHRKFVDCHSGSTNDDVPDAIQIQGFHEAIIPLRFSGNASIMAGAMPLKTGTGVAAGLYFDAPDYVPALFTTRLHWDEALPKYK